jgi:hypothetical protein
VHWRQLRTESDVVVTQSKEELRDETLLEYSRFTNDLILDEPILIRDVTVPIIYHHLFAGVLRHFSTGPL